VGPSPGAGVIPPTTGNEGIGHLTKELNKEFDKYMKDLSEGNSTKAAEELAKFNTHAADLTTKLTNEIANRTSQQSSEVPDLQHMLNHLTHMKTDIASGNIVDAQNAMLKMDNSLAKFDGDKITILNNSIANGNAPADAATKISADQLKQYNLYNMEQTDIAKDAAYNMISSGANTVDTQWIQAKLNTLYQHQLKNITVQANGGASFPISIQNPTTPPYTPVQAHALHLSWKIDQACNHIFSGYTCKANWMNEAYDTGTKLTYITNHAVQYATAESVTSVALQSSQLAYIYHDKLVENTMNQTAAQNAASSAAQNAQITNLHTQVTNLQNQIAELNKELANSNGQNAALADQVKSLQDQLADVMKRLGAEQKLANSFDHSLGVVVKDIGTTVSKDIAIAESDMSSVASDILKTIQKDAAIIKIDSPTTIMGLNEIMSRYLTWNNSDVKKKLDKQIDTMQKEYLLKVLAENRAAKANGVSTKASTSGTAAAVPASIIQHPKFTPEQYAELNKRYRYINVEKTPLIENFPEYFPLSNYILDIKDHNVAATPTKAAYTTKELIEGRPEPINGKYYYAGDYSSSVNNITYVKRTDLKYVGRYDKTQNEMNADGSIKSFGFVDDRNAAAPVISHTPKTDDVRFVPTRKPT
jgi:hypothetical protein